MTDQNTADGLERDPYVLNHPQTLPFWRAAAEGRLLLPRCRACARAHWYPRPFCPLCQSVDVEWEEASGKGVVYSFSIMRRAETPYCVALVTLDEGPTLMTNLIVGTSSPPSIGQRVKVAFIASPQGRRLPVFRPDDESP